jgi:hypothetical protein
MTDLLFILILGMGATATMDLWALLRRPLLGIAPPNYGLVGRWLAHMPRGQFYHDTIAKAAPIRGEKFIGWAAHYLIGITFAAALIAIWGMEWLHQPTLIPALVVGIGTVAAPFFIMQPGMGAGIAAAKTPQPTSARVQSLITHAVFGAGLYVAGQLTHLIYLP